jgi:hypothetical protein
MSSRVNLADLNLTSPSSITKAILSFGFGRGHVVFKQDSHLALPLTVINISFIAVLPQEVEIIQYSLLYLISQGMEI